MKLSEMSVSELLIGAGRGDERAFALLYRKTSANLFAICVRIVKNEAVAQECLQEAYVKIWNHAGRYLPERAQATTWMTTIVRNLAIDSLRRSGKMAYAGDFDLDTLSDESSEDEAFFHGSDARVLQACLDELREEPRHAIRLAYYDGMTHSELADHLGVPLGTVKTWIRRALEQLKQCLG